MVLITANKTVAAPTECSENEIATNRLSIHFVAVVNLRLKDPTFPLPHGREMKMTTNPDSEVDKLQHLSSL